MDELKVHAESVLAEFGFDSKYRDYAAVIINNEVWRDTVAGIPFEKRLLLLPKCIREPKQCKGEFDEIGLICEHCGGCLIDDYKSRAEELGYAVLVAEGSPVVMSLIETGQIEAVVGVSCLSVLERVFPYMEAGAIPGIAIPLLQDGCSYTTVDADMVWDSIYLTSERQTQRVDLDEIRRTVDRWFSPDSLINDTGCAKAQVESLALDWVAKAGKRWRPVLAACAYRSLAAEGERDLTDSIRKAAVAVECFHKASLIHDDIEDEDDLRYGEKTLHKKYGVAVALNVGDLLLGDGYRLLTELDASGGVKTALLTTAAQGHRNLCIGQGNELAWLREPRTLSTGEVIDIFEKKTSPAFEVALKFGAILAGSGDRVLSILSDYSRLLGVAYQVRDDLEDYYAWNSDEPVGPTRPSVLMAIAAELAESKADKSLLRSVWNRSRQVIDARDELKDAFKRLDVERVALNLMESYKARAIGTLAQLHNSNLKSLLRRVVGRIFGDFELMGCCDDHETGHGPGGEPGQKSAG